MPPLDFYAVFDASANAYMLLDRELRYVAANRAYLALTAARLDELVGRYVFAAFPNDPDDPNNRSVQLLRSSMEKVLRTGQRDVIAFVPYRVARTPGAAPEDRFWSATHSPVLDEHGAVAFVLQHTADVTELHPAPPPTSAVTATGHASSPLVETQVLRRAQQVQDDNLALDIELRRLRQMFDQAPGFMCFLRGPEFVFELSNQAYYDLVGNRDLLGRTVRAALPELAGQGFYELLDKVYREGQAFVGRRIPVRILRAAADTDPETIILDFMYQPIFGSEGQTVGILVQGNDVTEATRSEQRHRFLARVSEHFIDHGDVDAMLKKVAATAVELFADWCWIDLFTGEQTMRRLASAAADPAWQELAEEGFRYAPAGDTLDDHPTLGRHAGAVSLISHVDEALLQPLQRSPEHILWVRKVGLRSLLGVPLIARGQRLGNITLGLVRSGRRFDPHDKATAEELTRMVSTVLDNAILSRERADLLRREQAARERAEAANQAKDEFLAMLGHELRNPLSPILTAVQLMKLRGDTGTQREQVIIERQAQHLIRLVDDLLDVSRITRGKVELQKVPTDIASVITSAVEMASPLFEQKQHRLLLDVTRQLLVDGDPVRLSQVVANLLTNAARYTQTGGEVRVVAERSGSDIVIRVRDNGIGISADMLTRVFELFVQAPRRPNSHDGGLGLGLTLVRTLVGMHGGTVVAESAGLGLGSEFIVRLPALGSATTSSATRKPAGATPGAEGPGRRILVVDDNEDAGQLLAELLKRRGHTVALAHDGPTALALAQTFAPDLGILDIGLPVMDGYELAAQLRVTLGDKVPRLIALTGYGQEHDRRRSRESGFDAHLVKPIDAQALLRAIKAVPGGSS